MPKQVLVIQVLDFQNMEKGIVTLVTLEKGIVTPAVKIEKNLASEKLEPV